MNPDRRAELLDHSRVLCRSMIEGRLIVLAGHHLGGVGPWIEALQRLDAAGCFVLACAVGTGPMPDDSIARHVLGITGATPSAEIRAVNLALRDLTTEAIDALDRFDPDRVARVICPPYLDALEVGGRVVYGGRRPEWAALEDKTLADSLFDRAAVNRAPSAIVELDIGQLGRAVAELDRGSGTVWSGDARDGFHGGGDLVRRVRSDEVGDFATWFAERCDRVRVAPFLDGIPCSIHGFVCDDGVAAFRPMEMVILRRPDDHPDRARFVYAGMASLWDPAPDDRDEMREVARKVGRLLSLEVAYRGAYTVDGIMTVDGFRPTEVNPRFGGALGYAHAAVPELALPMLHSIAAAGDGSGLRADDLESLVTEAGDGKRWGSSNMFLPAPCSETSVYEVPGIGRITIGPGVSGTFARLEPDIESIEPGRSFAPLAVAAFGAAERDLGLPVGPLVAAPSLR
jgi:hypothetical protein